MALRGDGNEGALIAWRTCDDTPALCGRDDPIFALVDCDMASARATRKQEPRSCEAARLFDRLEFRTSTTTVQLYSSNGHRGAADGVAVLYSTT